MGEERLFPKELYHGTDLRVLGYSNAERFQLLSICSEIAEYAYQRLIEDGMSVFRLSPYKEKRGITIGADWNKFIAFFAKYDSFRRGSSMYQYEHVYLTDFYPFAVSYARDSFIIGERGAMAYWMWKVAAKIWDLQNEADSILLEKWNCLERKAIEKPKPIILVFDNVLETALRSEQGDDINWERDEKQYASKDSGKSFRFVGDNDIISECKKKIVL